MQPLPYQVDVIIQGEKYTIPVLMVDREIAFEKTEERIEALGLQDEYEGRGFGAFASDLKLSQVNGDKKLFTRIKALGVMQDSLNGLIEHEIEKALKTQE